MSYVKARDLAVIEHEPGLFAVKLIDGSRGARGVSLLRGWLDPGALHSLHTHDTEEVVVFLSGHAIVVMNGEQFEVGPGDAVLIPAGVPHSTSNASSDETVHFVAAFSDSVITSRRVSPGDPSPAAGLLARLAIWNRVRWVVRRLLHAPRG
jgi:mannose-6-phosphate isomerase-like protein (cupin superfamily)